MPPVELTVRYFAAAHAAAGSESVQVSVQDGTTVDDLIDRLGAGNPDLARVLVRCSFLRDGIAVRDRSQPLGRGVTIDVLPPFAGG
ncbi:MoaD/ThiS family protein [Candidatus Mycobacterium wuenschmannii]|uniref:MoaD/ThiS family protein n=1 Tax=Candidatus Mycobacterium wuenschmannii TaxID=3027808 RepID=A0ABY8VYM0_9MYCO|nr:MoaD/ThiS family protein [Candidatus Mycobacterium wuenschmannii]WIM88740.1 MoaD/ThiS family protein [Candidatus Mycobacterium wuenschmannii]